MAPVVLTLLFAYFHVSLQRVWELLADLPAVFPDGVPLDKRAYPWLLSGLVRSRLTLLKRQPPPLTFLQSGISSLLAYGLVPITLMVCWTRYWRGYKNAKRHYAMTNAVKRTPHGREELHRAIEEMLEKNLDMSAEEICTQLDAMGLSAYLDLKIKGKQKTILVGPKHPFCWKSVRKEDSLKNMISRLRKRIRNERAARAWMKLSDQAFSSERLR